MPTQHNYLYLAPDEDVPFPRHKRRPGKQSNLRQPRTHTKALTDCISYMPDGSTRNMSERTHKPLQPHVAAARAAQRRLDKINDRDERRLAQLAKVQAQAAELDHWNS